MIRIEQARNGSPIAVAAGQYLNSSYNPEREASRYVEKCFSGTTPGTVVILGETTGYLRDAVLEASPNSKILTVFFDDWFHSRSSGTADHEWFPGSGVEIVDFFLESIGEFDIGRMAVIEWEPTARIYPHIAQNSSHALRTVSAMRNGTIATTASYGALWLRNIISNYLMVNTAATPGKNDRPIVIAASGPTLSSCLTTLYNNRDSFELWALPSSLSALLANDLWPDVIVITDPSFYSVLHLKPIGEKLVDTVVLPLSAVKGASLFGKRCILLDQGHPLESTILRLSSIPHARVPANGTVAGTAFSLALPTGVPIVYAGLDFAARDLETHVRPHAFDRFAEQDARRTSPAHTWRFERVYQNIARGQAPSSLPLDTYANWFRIAVRRAISPVYRLHPSKIEIPGMTPLDEQAFRIVLSSNLTSKKTQNPPFMLLDDVVKKKSALLGILDQWQSLFKAASVDDIISNYSSSQTSEVGNLLYYVDARGVLALLKGDGVLEKNRRLELLRTTADRIITKLVEFVQEWPE